MPRGTITSKEPCPFCGCTRWVPWFVGGDEAQLDADTVQNPAAMALVDLGGDDHGDLADECDRCDAVVSTRVEVPHAE